MVDNSESQAQYRCPFFGLLATHGLLQGQQGNRCAISCAHHLCDLVERGMIPNWDACSRLYPERSAGLLEAYCSDGVRVCSEEFPNGIPFKSWASRMLSLSTTQS